MAAPRGVSDQQLREAILQATGNVQRTAEAMGMTRTAVYQRLERMGSAGLELRAASRALERSRSVRIKVDLHESLLQAGYDLAYVRRQHFSPEMVLEAFLREAFEPWLKGQLGAKRPPSVRGEAEARR